ncbi:MAG: hypothetical protein VX820_02345, partial [Candidatus Neomarinimicrobiota bacterium]|nr:hypothetical protein [Candidatus Neomarinimicrobiota bacterium]
MKRLMIIMCAVTALVFTQDAAGQYKLTGVDVEYTYIARGDYDLTVSDPYGFGITQTLATIPGGAPFTKQPMRLTDAALSALGINLNVTLNEDGTGSIAEGSFYPDVNTITDENGNCVTLQQVLPVTDEFTYTSNGSLGLTTGGYNVLGVPGISNTSGMGGLGLSGSLTFEDYPMIPSHPTLCDPDGNDCFPFTVGDLDESGTIEVYPDVNLLGIPEYVPGGAPLSGISGGLFKKAGLNDDGVALESIYNGSDEDFPGYVNTTPDFILNWHGVDGGSSGLGLGDDESDEDGDGTWFDRDLGIPGATASFIAAECGGGSQPTYGDLSSLYPDGCVTVDLAASGFLMDPSGSLATWGNYLTANAALAQMCQGYAEAGQIDPAACAAYLVDDSADEMDAACLSDYTPGNLAALADCSGKLTMNFDIPCVPVIEAREVVAEFIEVGGDACGTGDMNADGGLNVLDVVALVNIVLSGADADCTGDMNG